MQMVSSNGHQNTIYHNSHTRQRDMVMSTSFYSRLSLVHKGLKIVFANSLRTDHAAQVLKGKNTYLYLQNFHNGFTNSAINPAGKINIRFIHICHLASKIFINF